MSSRRLLQGRHRDRPAASSSSRRDAGASNVSAELPAYEWPSCPLSDHARRALASLSNHHDTRNFDKQLQDSLHFLSDAVQATNDRLTDRRDKLDQLKRRRLETDEGKTARERAEEKAVKRLQDEVPGLTADCEKAVRKAVDLNVQVEDEKAALAEMAQRVQQDGAGPTSVAQGRRRRRAVDDEGDEDLGVDEPAEILNPLQILQESRDKLAAEYAAKSLYQRYGLNNDYIGFKKLWHESTHEEGVPVPDPTRWFTDDHGEVLPAHGEDDDEFIVAGEKTSLKCPLSLQIMKEPYGSNKCKHTFEKAAILEYLQSRKKKCPEAGCNADISPKDLYLNQVVLRRIKRAQASEARNHGRSDGLDEEVDEDGDTSMRITQEQNIRPEKGIKRETGAAKRGRRRMGDDVEDEDEGE